MEEDLKILKEVMDDLDGVLSVIWDTHLPKNHLIKDGIDTTIYKVYKNLKYLEDKNDTYGRKHKTTSRYNK